jgi:Fe-S-cluster containining protein
MKDHFLSITVAGADARVLGDADPMGLFCGINGCDANCCTKSAPIVLNPYEIALICRESGMSYEDLLDIVDTDRAKAFPLVMLPRDPACHFWNGRGCRIYAARPLACRLYPIGRVFDQGRSHIVLPELNVCPGLSSGSGKTVSEYLCEQDTSLLIRMADRWIEFGARSPKRRTAHVSGGAFFPETRYCPAPIARIPPSRLTLSSAALCRIYGISY